MHVTCKGNGKEPHPFLCPAREWGGQGQSRAFGSTKAHIVAGIIFVSITAVRAYQLRGHRKSILLIDMCNTYWHFIGLLWVYLYLFFYFAH